MGQSVFMPKEAPIYSEFAKVYDLAMRHVPFFKWAAFIDLHLKKNNILESDPILDLGCGTGKLSAILGKTYENIVGLDISYEMLIRALNKKRIKENIQGSMTCLPIKSNQFKAIICTHDTLNYANEIDEVHLIFAECSRVLQPGGLFIFDLATKENVLGNFADVVIEEQHGDLHLLWQNYYNHSIGSLKSTITFTSSSGESMVEEHLQQIYSLPDLLPAIEKSGFEFLYDCFDYSMAISLAESSQLQVAVCKRRPL